MLASLSRPTAVQRFSNSSTTTFPSHPAGQVRLKLLATGVAFADVLMRYGMYPHMPALPFSPGYDVVGVIDKLGAGVTNFVPGDTVTAMTMIGGYSQYLCLTAADLVRVPGGLDPAEAVEIESDIDGDPLGKFIKTATGELLGEIRR